MSSKKPRKPKRVLVNPLAHAIAGARKLDVLYRDNIVTMLDKAWRTMREGGNRSRAWMDIAFMANVSQELSTMGICSDEASRNKTVACEAVLVDWAQDALKDWQDFAITDDDAEIVEEALFLWQIQLDFVSMSEFEKARSTVVRKQDQALKGNAGQNTEVVCVKTT